MRGYAHARKTQEGTYFSSLSDTEALCKEEVETKAEMKLPNFKDFSQNTQRPLAKDERLIHLRQLRNSLSID